MPKRAPKSVLNTLSSTFEDIMMPQSKLFPDNLNVSDLSAKPPCYDEFMKLTECLNKNSCCKKEYESLLKCLQKEWK